MQQMEQKDTFYKDLKKNIMNPEAAGTMSMQYYADVANSNLDGKSKESCVSRPNAVVRSMGQVTKSQVKPA